MSKADAGQLFSELTRDLELLGVEVGESLKTCMSRADLENYMVMVLGKRGSLTAILRRMGALSLSERSEFGHLANKASEQIRSAFESAEVWG